MTNAKPLRADARRNRARLLEVAEAVFAANGASASTEEVARAAGVGVGTVFRHFPTKEALLEAVLAGRLRRLAAEATSLADAYDPGQTFFAFFTRVVEQSATKNAYVDALATAGVDVAGAVAPAAQELHQALETLLTRAQQANAVRNDVRIPDLIALLVGATRAFEHLRADPDAQARTLAIMLDGIRAR
jgi:AcrR family transcriptional regulator